MNYELMLRFDGAEITIKELTNTKSRMNENEENGEWKWREWKTNAKSLNKNIQFHYTNKHMNMRTTSKWMLDAWCCEMQWKRESNESNGIEYNKRQ